VSAPANKRGPTPELIRRVRQGLNQPPSGQWLRWGRRPLLVAALISILWVATMSTGGAGTAPARVTSGAVGAAGSGTTIGGWDWPSYGHDAQHTFYRPLDTHDDDIPRTAGGLDISDR
jgi:hypothetical protein